MNVNIYYEWLYLRRKGCRITVYVYDAKKTVHSTFSVLYRKGHNVDIRYIKVNHHNHYYKKMAVNFGPLLDILPRAQMYPGACA